MARNQQLSPYRGGEVTRGSDPFMSLHRDMNRLFDDVFRGFGLPMAGAGADRRGDATFAPDIDVSETAKEFKICADLPGVSEQDVDVSITDDVLQIRAERRQERKQDEESFHVVERSYGMFQRTLRLPANIDAERVQADFLNGVLTVTIPKVEDHQRSRRIHIQGGKQQPSRDRPQRKQESATKVGSEQKQSDHTSSSSATKSEQAQGGGV